MGSKVLRSWPGRIPPPAIRNSATSKAPRLINPPMSSTVRPKLIVPNLGHQLLAFEDRFSVENGYGHFYVFNLGGIHVKNVVGQNREVCKLSRLDRTFSAIF